MKVLYISNVQNVNKDEALCWFREYCEEVDLFLHTNLNSAKQFLIRQIIENQKHIDFIIMNWSFNFQNAKSLLSWLRESNETYSSYNFMFRSIPVLLIEDTSYQSSFISDGFDGVVGDFPSNQLRLKLTVKNAIKTWRYSLADDLDLIGLDPKTQKIYPNQRINFIAYYRLKVLSRKFVDGKSKRLNYIWTNSKIRPLNDSNQVFLDKMNRTIKNPPKYLEKEFHDFFIENPTFIKGEDFIATPNEMLYEKHFYKNGSRKYDEPDFVNKPHAYAIRSPEVFEIKRQSQRLVRHQDERFISKAKKSFEQIKRYKEFMTSDNPQNKYYIKLYLGKLYSSFEYTLLMGSISEKQEHADLIERLTSDFDFDEINLLTYEELLERHVRLCDRLDEFNIF
ncbi:MAG: tRNA amino-acyl synthetase [Bacteroidia bacterium]|nr:tRNA amino-acyl synthetase [Bacteroidia bacterium]